MVRTAGGTTTIEALGTFATVLTAEPNAIAYAVELLREALDAIDVACSRFRTDSELTAVNNAASRMMSVSPLFAKALAIALEAAWLTDGDVDPTCGLSLIRLGYDRDFAAARHVTTPLRQPPMPGGGWRGVILDHDRRTVRVPPGAALDLGATAKAFAADQAAASIAAAIRCGTLVNLGGDISVAGEPPDGGWLVGIADDVGFDTAQADMRPQQLVTIRDGGLATSRVLGRSWRRGEDLLHHILLPSTGRPVRSCWRTASVAAATCVDANIASTAAIVRAERAAGWLEGLRLPARLVRHDGSVVKTGGWP